MARRRAVADAAHRRKPASTYNQSAYRGLAHKRAPPPSFRPGDRHAQVQARDGAVRGRRRAHRGGRAMSGLVAPLGGTLVDRRAGREQAAELEGRAAGLPSIELNLSEAADLELIA